MVELCGLDDLGITTDGCMRLITLYASLIPDKLEMVFDDLSKTSSAGAATELKSHMVEPIAKLCEKARAQL